MTQAARGERPDQSDAAGRWHDNAQAASPRVLCDDAHKTYTTGGRNVQALRGASLRIDGAGFFAVMGRSGSGKSTLLHLLAGLDRPDSGRVELDGVDVGGLSDRAATEFRRTRLGIVFQSFNLVPTLTAEENVELPGMLAGADAKWLRGRSRELLDELGIGERHTHRPEALSGGEQQRVAIARSLLYSPPVLLADEPTGALDSASAETLWSLLGRLASERSITVVMVTHEPAAAAHCERVFVISDGRVTDDFGTEGLDAAGVAARYEQSGRS